MTDPDLDLDDFLAAAQIAGFGAVDISAIANENPSLVKQLESFDPLKTAATFSGLLSVSDLQSNCFRLEILVHLALSYGKGQRKPPEKFARRAFATLGQGLCGRLEDPAEDVFVTSIETPRGNFRVLEGIWEAAGFFLQRFVNVAEDMPRGSVYDDIRESVYSLLRLSDLFCERAELVRFQMGNPIPVKSLPGKLARSLGSLRRLVRFSQEEIEGAGISIDHLSEFIFLPGTRSGLLNEMSGHSTLERYPVALRNTDVFFVLPTATSAGIRRFVIEKLRAAGLQEAFLASLAKEYAEVFSGIPLLGGQIGAPIEFKRTANGLVAGVTTTVDFGRYINFIFFIDTLEDFEKAGLAGHNPDLTLLADDVDRWIDHSYQAAQKEDNFLDGLTLLVGCGVGRGAVSYLNNKERPNWRVEFVSAPDLFTLSWTPKFEPLSLWRILDARDKVQSLGVGLHNVNGLLNMVAWSRSLDGHLVPHGQLPDDFVSEKGSSFIMIEQNSQRKLRQEVALAWDPHAEQDMHGRWQSVRKEGQSLFEEDRQHPLYVSYGPLGGGRPRGVYVTNQRPWWCDVDVSDSMSDHIAYERWKMMTVWLQRAVPVFERTVDTLPTGPILWQLKFEGNVGHLENDIAQIEFSEARGQISVVTEPATNTISMVVGEKFEAAIFNADNIAERALVHALTAGVAKLAGQELNDGEQNALVAAIVPDHSARQLHAFRAQQFRDYVKHTLPNSPIIIDGDDDAALKLGLGWRVHSKSDNAIIEGKTECTSFLNRLVKVVEDELCDDLRKFDRLSMIEFTLRNHEVAVCDRDRWSRTAAAVLSLRDDKTAARAAMTQHEFKLNAVFLATRLLVEFALCECPIEGGRKPGQLDLSRLMAKAALLFGMGGWSDAVRWDVMEPRIRVTPLGDVYANLGFVDDVITPFAQATTDARVSDAVEKYAENLEEPTFHESTDELIEGPFLDAWKEEFGASLDETRLFIDFVEDLGIRTETALLKIPRSQLLAVKVEERSVPADIVEQLVECLTLKSRASWRDIPPGFEDRDRQPWRFRRRLTVLRKPLVQINDDDDPLIIVAPGILRDSIHYMMGNYFRGDFPGWQLKNQMSVWAGKASDKRGKEFSFDAAARLTELGWQTEVEINVTKLLRQGFDRNYGDVDVLAWNPQTGRVLIIECKDLQYRKTYGEIAEQLGDFRGELGPHRKPDYLLRHLNRVDIISKYLPLVAKHVGMECLPKIESYLVFRNPVPMEFALEKMSERVSVVTFDRLSEI